MKIIRNVVAVLGVLALIHGLTAQAQTSQQSGHREITTWVDSPTGSFVGRGYASSYLTNIRPKTIGKEDPALRTAIRSLDGLGMLAVKGFGLLPAAVAWQTGVAMPKLIEQQAETGLSFGELLIANSLATKSQKSFGEIVALRAKTRTWGELAERLQINPDFIITRANIAAERIVTADFRSQADSHAKNISFINGYSQHNHAQHH